MESNTVEVNFFIFGENISPPEITTILNIMPTSYGIKGELIPSRNSVCKDSFWSIGTGIHESVDVGDQVSVIYNLLLPISSLLIDTIKQYELICKLEVVLLIYNEPTPAINIEVAFMELFGRLNCRVSMPLYIFMKPLDH